MGSWDKKTFPVWACRENLTLTFYPGFSTCKLTPKTILGQNLHVKFFTEAPQSKVIFEVAVTKRAGNDTFH